MAFIDTINPLHIEDLNNPMHLSKFEDAELYSLLILRLPLFNKPLTYESYGFIFSANRSFIYSVKTHELQTLDEGFLSCYTALDRKIDKIVQKTDDYLNTVTQLEDALYEHETKHNFIKKWFHLKKDLTRIERTLFKSVDIMDQFITYYEKEETFVYENFMDLKDHLEKAARSCSLQLAKLDVLYSFYNTQVNEKTNRVVYVLTVVSAIFLPLNLMVGYFGMNTSNLPFTGETDGTYKATLLLSALILISVILIAVFTKSTLLATLLKRLTHHKGK